MALPLKYLKDVTSPLLCLFTLHCSNVFKHFVNDWDLSKEKVILFRVFNTNPKNIFRRNFSSNFYSIISREAFPTTISTIRHVPDQTSFKPCNVPQFTVFLISIHLPFLAINIRIMKVLLCSCFVIIGKKNWRIDVGTQLFDEDFTGREKIFYVNHCYFEINLRRSGSLVIITAYILKNDSSISFEIYVTEMMSYIFVTSAI